MDYGEQKARGMARSLLPSTWRGAHRERAGHHRAARRQTHMELARLARDPEAHEELDLREVEVEEAGGVRAVVSHRRHADKVNPFIRWATAVTRHLPRESRLSHVRGCLPRGVIGEHALSHLRWAPAFEDPREAEWRRAWWGSRPRPWLERGEYAELLRELLRVGGHEPFNRWMRLRHLLHETRSAHRWDAQRPDRLLQQRMRLPPGALRPRLLLGLHDVLPFLDAVGCLAPRRRGPLTYPPREMSPEWFTAMDRFLRAFKQARGDLAATLRALKLSPE